MSGIVRRRTESTAARSAEARAKASLPESVAQGIQESDEEDNDEQERESNEEEDDEQESDEEDESKEEEESDTDSNNSEARVTKKVKPSAAKKSTALAKLTPYELLRQKNIERNLEVFRELGISSIATEVTAGQITASTRAPAKVPDHVKKISRRSSTSYVGLVIDVAFSF